ncbi:MAG: nitrate reductase [Alteromonadaceae bacterium]|nr:MAG: nitrate reductase [Alteromonadaceae bacterium]
MSDKTIHTTCAYCGVGCGIKAVVNDDLREVAIKGLDSHPSNHGRLCSKGTALGDTIGLSERLLEPEVNGQAVSWDHALDTVADGFAKAIEQYGPDSVAFYLSGQFLTEDYYVANKLMKGFIGSANIDTNSRLCMSSTVSGHKRAFGTDTVPGCYEDFEQAEVITLVGSNAAWCHPVLFQRIRAYKEANPQVKIVVIDPRRTQTCDIADLHLPIALGADNWLFNGLLSHLAQTDQLDHDYIEQHCDGFESSLAAAQAACPSTATTAQKCGLDQDDVATFFNWFGQTNKTVTLFSQGVNQSSSGTDKVNSIINCHLATGSIGKPGTGPFSITGQPNAMGGREVGGLANTLASHMEFSPDNIDRLQRFWGTDKVAAQAGLTAVELFNAIDDGRIKAVWIMATNPVVSLPDADKVKAALQKCPLVVVSDCIANTDTARLAHVKFPATGWSEKNGTVTSSERRISRQRNLFPPAGQAKHDWWMICQVAKRLGHSEAFDYQHPSEIFSEHARLSGFENSSDGQLRDFDISALENISEQDYEQLVPFQWPMNKEYPQGCQRLFANGDFFTPNRKARFVAITPRAPANAPTPQYPLRLNTGRIRDQWHTMTRTGLAPQLNQHIKEPFIELHPDDASALHLRDQQLVSITSRWGSMLARLNICESINGVNSIRSGECFAPIHWTGELSRHGRVGPVVNPVVDPICFQPESKHTPVQISPYQAVWHGLLLTRQKAPWPDESEYLVESNGQQHTLLTLAGQSLPSEPLEQITSWLNAAEDWELLSYQDPQGHYRIAAIDADGKLQAIAMLSTRQDLPEPGWLGQQFSKDSLDLRTRTALLSGRAPAGEDIGRIVCACYSVGEKTICKAIQDEKLNSCDAIGRQLKAGTNCGSCIPELKALLAKA